MPTVSSPKIIRDKAFASRLTSCVDNHPRAPHGHGKQRWLLDMLDAKFGETYSSETARKWFSGENRPRPKVMQRIAQVLDVDEAWLSLGIKPVDSPRERQRRSISEEGAVSYVAGLIQLSGLHIALPDEDDGADPADLYGIVTGKKVQIQVIRPIQGEDGAARLHISRNYARRAVLVVAPGVDPLHYNIFRIPQTAIAEYGRDRGGYVELSAIIDGKKLSIDEVKLSPLSALDAATLT